MSMAEDIPGQRHDRTALILYGSETGNSEDIAEDLGRMAERLRFSTRVSQMDQVEPNELEKYTIVIFTLSTTGQGEFPKNGRKFWKRLLRKRLPPDYFSHVQFTLFGLGDSSYPKFNFSCRKLQKRLQQLGAQEIYPRGEADDQHHEGIEGTFLPWCTDLRKHLLATYPLPEGVEPIPLDVRLPPKFILEMDELSIPRSDDPMDVDVADPYVSDHRPVTTTPQPGDWTSKLIYKPEPEPESASEIKCPQLRESHPETPEPIDLTLPPANLLPIQEPWDVKLLSNKRMTPDTHWQDVRELTFTLPDEVDLFPGNYMIIYPKNFPEDVQKLINLQGWNEVADHPLHFKPKSPNWYTDKFLATPFPNMPHVEKCTLRDLLTHYLDITAIPKRYFFEIAAYCSNDKIHRDRLSELYDPLNIDEFRDYATRPRRSILEVLHDFSSVKLPWQEICTIFPTIRGRSYSICNGGVQRRYGEKGTKITILVAIVKYRTFLKTVRQGLCSRYLASLQTGTTIRVCLPVDDDNEFYKIAKDVPHVPIIFIAPGTGLAPCRSLIWERAALAWDEETKGIDVGRSYLFFGGRNKDADFFYKEDWDLEPLKTTVFTAFSRDQKEKIYVQDIIRENGELIYDLFCNQAAMIYICGSSGNMPKAVCQALIDVIFKWSPDSKITREGAEIALDTAAREGYFIQETW